MLIYADMQHIEPDPSPATPLEQLSSALSEDMAAVNALIMKYMESDVAMVKQVAAYLIMAGGKRIRPLLTLAFSKLCADPNEKSHALAAAVEFIHTATLLHDDVVDESNLRRGQESANAIHGNQMPVLVGDFLFSRAFQMMVSTNSLEALKILSDTSAVIAEGEVLQLSIQGKLDIERDEYFKVLRAKTAVLFAAACQVGALVSGGTDKQIQAAYDFGLNLGLAFQIIDDVIDYGEGTGKGQGDDFRDGKITLPVFIAYQAGTAEEKEFWENSIVGDNRDDFSLKKAIDLLNKHNALEKSRTIAQDYADKAQATLAAFDQSNLSDILKNVLDFTLSRKY